MSLIEKALEVVHGGSKSPEPSLMDLDHPTIGKLIIHLNKVPNVTGEPFTVQTSGGEVTVDPNRRVIIPNVKDPTSFKITS